MQWSTPTAHVKKKTNDWFISLIIIAGALIFIAILLHNYILAALVLALTVALIIAHSAPHNSQNVELRTGGIIVDNMLYPWETIEAFSLQEYYGIPRLLLKSRRQLAPIISIPIDEEAVDIEELRSMVEDIIPEANIHEPLLHLIAERFGL
jgi:hypothetical protein